MFIVILTPSATKAIAGKDIILAIFDKTGAKLLAISGQQGLTINRTADSIEVSSKDTKADGNLNSWYERVVYR
ncbi:antigen A [Streptococcus dysgalactiae subsp. equisimilis]|nr:phage major tail protein, TP901-1 family [Streptococcus dysgalactiae]VTT18313.1 antigen A [Streptococcus dysgalactiae subsp. equisimilis]